MRNNILLLAKIARIDKILDDFEDELGDLPKMIKIKEAKISEIKNKITETEQIIADVRAFVATSKSTLISLKEKEDKLTEQQFLVRNNKEFDAITAEVASLKIAHEKLSVKMRTEGLKENNLIPILETQKSDLVKATEELNELLRQLDELATEQDEEVQVYNKVRKKLKTEIDENLYDKYAAIRTRLPDAAVEVKSNSCSGCYRSIPPQIIVEMRNQLDRVFQCENCGRILIPEWIEINEDDLLQ
jgi:predicted  nucleic acid-binding Zn-ribbon protein